MSVSLTDSQNEDVSTYETLPDGIWGMQKATKTVL